MYVCMYVCIYIIYIHTHTYTHTHTHTLTYTKNPSYQRRSGVPNTRIYLSIRIHADCGVTHTTGGRGQTFKKKNED